MLCKAPLADLYCKRRPISFYLYCIVLFCIGAIESLRSDADSFPWKEAERMASIIDVTLAAPRLVGRQQHRANADIGSGSVQDYYRINVYYPFVDHVLLQLKERFSGHFSIIKQLSALIPGLNSTLESTDDSINVAAAFHADFVDTQKVTSEVKVWNSKWAENKRKQIKLPMNALESLEIVIPHSTQTYGNC